MSVAGLFSVLTFHSHAMIAADIYILLGLIIRLLVDVYAGKRRSRYADQQKNSDRFFENLKHFKPFLSWFLIRFQPVIPFLDPTLFIHGSRHIPIPLS
jgi:hypothetical protein